MGSDIRCRVLSEPITLHWQGWETTTLRLQSAGWSLSADQDLSRMTMHVAFRKEVEQGQTIMGITEVAEWDYIGRSQEYIQRALASGRGARLRVAAMAEVVSLHVRSGHGELYRGVQDDFNNYNPVLGVFTPIDAYPHYAQLDTRTLDSLVHFAPALASTREIIVPEPSVSDLLEEILRKQDPAKQKHFLEEAKKATTLRTIHAKIISIAV